MVDVAAGLIDAANGDWRGAHLSRVALAGCRLTGLSLTESSLEDVHFEDCKLDLVNLRGARLERVVFHDCVLTWADLGGARLTSVRFDACRMDQVEIRGAELAVVDFRGSDLQPTGDGMALRGAIIDTTQLINLAPVLAAALGVAIEDEVSP